MALEWQQDSERNLENGARSQGREDRTRSRGNARCRNDGGVHSDTSHGKGAGPEALALLEAARVEAVPLRELAALRSPYRSVGASLRTPLTVTWNPCCRKGRNRTCQRQFYLPLTGFEDQLKHQFRPLRDLFITGFFSVFLRKVFIRRHSLCKTNNRGKGSSQFVRYIRNKFIF